MIAAFRRRRSQTLALAAAMLCAACIVAHGMPLAERITDCGTCHGHDGNSSRPNVPSLAGQPLFFLLNQLVLMREGVRRVPEMTPFNNKLSDGDVEAMANHFASLPPKASDESVDPSLVRRGAQLVERMHCGSCHLPTLAGRNQMPRLARQRVDYLIHSMRSFRDGTRSGADTHMNNVLTGTSDADLVALAHYAASR
jgi:cytochrome c553